MKIFQINESNTKNKFAYIKRHDGSDMRVYNPYWIPKTEKDKRERDERLRKAEEFFQEILQKENKDCGNG